MAAATLLAVAAAAGAQGPTDPYATTEQQAKQNDLDTDLTPVAKESKLWQLVHGTEFPGTEPMAGSVTTFDTDLFAVSFRNRTIGLAGGSACEVAPRQQEGEPDAGYGRRVSDCRQADGSAVDRVPAVYRYTAPLDSDPRWERLELPHSKRAGYVGAIAWIDSSRALLVGGTGAYPRREEPDDGRSSVDPDKVDSAGRARAWIYHRGIGGEEEAVEELDLSDLTADAPGRAGMRGLTAVDCYEDPRPGWNRFSQPDPDEPEIQLCFAGGLGQIWELRDGAFTGERVDALSPTEELRSASLFRYRVRDIRFVESDQPAAAIAVTAGCCATNELENTPRLLLYNDEPRRWFAYSMNDRTGSRLLNEGKGAEIRDDPVVQGADEDRQRVNANPELPDSFYSLTLNGGSGSPLQLSVIASPGGSPTDPERPSVISRRYVQGSSAPHTARYEPPTVEPSQDLIHTPLSTARLVSGDGDSVSVDPLRPAGVSGGIGDLSTSRWEDPDGVPDWAVGELRSTKLDGLGSRGLVVATGLSPTARDGINEGRGTTPPQAEELAEGSWEPADDEKLAAYVRSRHYLLPSYSANAVEIVGDEVDGWAVGDRGAILRLSISGVQERAATAEPEPPRLGAARHAELGERTPYDGARSPLPAGVGEVPRFGDETVSLAEPRMVLMGAAPPGQIVMSRDASEGWAIDGNTFSHFDGTRWTRCDPVGVEGLRAPDPACAEMAPLGGYRNAAGNLRTAEITHAARVPLEYDDDPSNDDEFEIVAVGTDYRGPEYENRTLPAVIRYRDGRWRFAEVGEAAGAPERVIGMVFATPEEGWAAARDSSNAGQIARIYRFDGERWSECTPGSAPCEDPDGRLPGLSAEIAGLTVAGERVYLFGNRRIADNPTGPGALGTANRVPLIIYRDPGGAWTDGSEPGGDGAGHDPAFADPATREAGQVQSLSVVENGRGELEGWAVGSFSSGADNSAVRQARVPPPDAALLRLDTARGEGWQRFRSPGPIEDYLVRGIVTDGFHVKPGAGFQVTYPSDLQPDGAFIGQLSCCSGTRGSRIFGFDASRRRFELLRSARPQEGANLNALRHEAHPAGDILAMAADGDGGFWANVSGYLFRWTDEAPKPVFEEAPNPLGSRAAELRDLAGGPDGSVWGATNSERIFRHDRVTGWQEVRVPGWDPGRVVTRASEAEALAIGPDGEGLVIGEDGRIANISPEGTALDPAAGRSCALGDPIPCGTSRDLTAVDLAPDGSALVAGDRLSILWRPAGGAFRIVDKPPIVSSTRITAISFTTPTRAYLTTDKGIVFRGDMSGAGSWRWQAENVRTDGEVIGGETALSDVAVDASGHGYAVGGLGVVLERREGHGWRLLSARDPIRERLTEVELPVGGGDGALIGGSSGLVLGAHGADLYVARPADFRGESHLTGPVLGFAYLPGSGEGSLDVWVGIGASGTSGSRIFRHRSDPRDGLLDPSAAARSLPDAPVEADGEIAIAAFGKSDCDRAEQNLCPEMSATTTTNEVVTERIVDELADRKAGGELDVAILTGDATDSATRPASSVADTHRIGMGDSAISNPTREAGALKHRRWTELVADTLDDRNVPLFGAVGGQDLTETFVCETEGRCATTKTLANGGENFAWREAFAGRAEGWGDGGDLEGMSEPQSEVELVGVRDRDATTLRTESQGVDVDGDGPAPKAKVDIGGANTHYGVDVRRRGEPVARIVFVDSSLRSLAASDPLQQPQEPGGGQARFLERMICEAGSDSTFGDRCTREKRQRVIVVSNTPSYSYGPGALTHTATDAATFEALMLRHEVDLVISGALGYNGLYWTLAPGVHEPCPGGEHPKRPPQELPSCDGGADSLTAPLEGQRVTDPRQLLEEQGITGAVPTLIAAGAGGKFGPDGSQQADGPAGQWHGYSVARLRPDGEVIVEQRPILDWIGMDAAEHTLHARARLKLNGYGRSPISTTTEDQHARAFHYDISNAAITHRYDLVLADPDQPWLPCEADDPDCEALHAKLSVAPGEPVPTSQLASAEEPANASAAKSDSASQPDNLCSPYLCLPERIATVDRLSGEVKAGDGKYPETFAIAMLSVDDKVATYPLVFKPSPSFVVTPFEGPPSIPANAQPAAPPPPNLPKPQIPSLTLATPPTLPAIPPLVAATPPEPAPPAPPAPPPPAGQPSPLNLSVAPTGLTVATPTAVIQPPTPPVNPAPPGGARREARQRQAAAQKSGADSDQASQEGISEGSDNDLAQSPATRYENPFRAAERSRSGPSFTPRPRAGQPSAWSSGALYTGGITLMAFALAAGWTRGRPTPRRREPRLPAPVFAEVRHRVRR